MFAKQNAVEWCRNKSNAPSLAHPIPKVINAHR